MDGFRHVFGAECAVDFLGDVGNERRGAFREGDEHVIERGIGVELVGVVLALPEAAAAAADIPVCEIFHEFFEAVRRALEMIGVHRLADFLDHIGERGENPAVERICRVFRRFEFTLRRFPAVDVRISREEAVCVPDRKHDAAEDFLDSLFGELEVFGADDRRAEQEQTQRIRSVRVDDVQRVRIVLFALGHLLSVFREDESVDDDVARRRLSEQRGGEHDERVEPSSGLVEPFRDEIGGEMFVEVGFVFKRIMLLRVGHGAAFKPAVEHFRDAGQDRAGFRLDRELVDEMLVDIVDLLSGELFEFGDGADADRFAGLFAAPDRERTSPVAVAADGPVAGVFEPLAETAFLDVFRNPGHPGVGLEHFLLDAVDAYEPGGDRLVDQRGVVAPAVRVVVFDRAAMNKLAFVLQTLDDVFVGVLDIDALVIGNLFCEFALFIKRADFGNAVRLSGDRVVFTESRGDMDDACTVFGADIFGVDHAECAFGLLVCKVVEERRVSHAVEVFAFTAGDDGGDGVLFVVGVQARLGEDVERSFIVDFDVVDVGTGSERHVGGQGPRSRGPCKEIGVFFAVDFEADGDGGVVDFHISLVCFEIGERSCAAGAVREDFMTFVDQSLVPELFEDPPDGFHVIAVHGAVAVFEIDPAAHALDDLLPLFGVAEDDPAAGFVEFVNAVGFDFAFSGEMKHFLHFIFDGEPVTVPAESAFAVFSAHGLIAGNDIFNGAGEEVSIVRQSGCERGAVVENEFR